MIAKKPADIAASVRQRLLNVAREQEEDFQLVLTRFVLERLLYRLGCSGYRDQFILKGAMLFSLWGGMPHRTTRDMDLLGFGESAVANLVQTFQDLCHTQVEDDGVKFPSESVRGFEIREDQEYDGVRIMLEARLGSARIPVQVDIGFGDAVTPAAESSVYPVMLDFPAPYLRTYPRETVVAEKFQAMIHLGMANSRMKDIYDLRFLATAYPFAGEILATAIESTFMRRKTALSEVVPLALTPEFSHDPGKQIQWRAFLKRNQLIPLDVPLSMAIDEIREFLLPPLYAAARGEGFYLHWSPSGPWRQVQARRDDN